MKYKYRKFNTKNILYTQNYLDKKEKEKLEKEKEEKLKKLEELREEIYSDYDSEENEMKYDYEFLVGELSIIKNKPQLIKFVKEYKEQINELEDDDKHKLLNHIQLKYF